MTEMNQEDVIKKLNEFKDIEENNEKEYQAALDKYRGVQNALFEQRKRMKTICNHKYADGSSAVEVGYAHGFCKICLVSD